MCGFCTVSLHTLRTTPFTTYYRGYRAASEMASDGRGDVSGEGDVLEGLESLSETNKQKVLEYISQMQQGEGYSGRMEQDLHTAHLQSGYVQKVGCYSGSKDLGKGEINYPQWRHEVICLVSEGYPVSTVLQSIRRSLRNGSRGIVKHGNRRPASGDC